MCGRTSLYAPLSDLEARFDATVTFDYEPRYNVAPGEDLATVRNEAPEEIARQNWGLTAPWADDPDDGPRPINARAETLTEKPLFETPVEERRCLVLADGFYEWSGERDRKQPYRVHLRDDDPFAMAGLWNRWEGDGRTLETVAVVTCEPNDVVAPIHDRMPAILAPDEEATWLEGSVGNALDVLGPYGGDDLEAYPVSTAVNDPGYDHPDVLLEAENEQAGLEEFGS